ncbi:MAG: hypothetical protein SFW07_04310 [Gammaproteobacteria bacterium]|nr:hypothetical protein [Gammaproteobacteria bacterium]
MKEGDKEKLMGQRIISGADVTWEQYWEVYAVGGLSHDEVLRALKINISSDNLQNIEQFAGDPSAADYQAKFMQAVEELKKQNPDAIYGETTKLTRAGTQNSSGLEVQVADDEPDSYEMDIENRVKPRLNSPLQPFRDAAASAKGKIVTAFQIPTLPKRQKSVKASKQNVYSQHANEFAETENNRDDIANFGFDIEGYRNSDYVQSEAAKFKHDPTVRAVSRDSVEEVLDNLRNEFMDKWYGAQLTLRDKSPEKNQEKNYGNIMEYAKALNNILKACAEKTGAPEWMPDAKLMAPLQWMLAQRSTPGLNALYSQISDNISLVIAREEDVAQQQVAAQKEAEAAQLKQWGIERMSAPVVDDSQVTWKHYWIAYDEALQNLSSSEKPDREKSFEAHRVACLVLGVDIKNLEDNDRTVFMKSTPETYRQNFMRAVVDGNLARGEKAAHAERAEKNAAKLKNLIAELNDMNSKNFSEFISDKTISKVMELLQQYPKDRMVKEFVSLYMQAVNYFKQIAALEDVDPIERAGKIAELLLQDGGRAFQVIVAFTSFENVVSSRYAAEPNSKNKPDIAQRNLEKLQLGSALIKPFQWLLKYKLHLPLINELVDVSGTMEKFDRIGSQANAYQREIDPLVKQMEQVAKLENSGKLTTEKTKEIISTAQRINRLMPGLEPLVEKIASDSDTESPEGTPRSTTPVTSDDESYEESIDDYEDSDPVVIQAPGDLDVDIREQGELQSVPAASLVQSYQQMREAFAQGYFEKAKNLLVGIYAAMVQAKQPKALGGDELLDELIKVVQQSQPTNFDVRMGNRLAGIFSDDGEGAYLCATLSVAVRAVEQDEKLLPTSGNKAIESYNKIHELFKNSPDPFTMRGPRDVVKVTRAYREVSRLDIGAITNAILQDPGLADAFFKRRIGTRLPGRRNFRKEFAEHPELLEKLIDSRDPVILASMRDMGLLQTSHLSESNRSQLIERNTYLNNESVLNDQDMLARAAENLEAMKPQESVEDLIAELDALKFEKESKGEHQQECLKELDKINNKQLANALKEKIAQHPSEKFPDLDQMKAFVKDINDNLKMKDGVGLDYKRYLIMLTDSKYDGKFMSLFKLESADFPSNNKGFQRPLPPRPSAQAKSSDAPKPHHGGK